MKRKIFTAICFMALLLSGCMGASESYFEKADMGTEKEEALTEAASEESCETESFEECYVYVCGAVKNPGVYQLFSKSRVYEAVLAAGGLLENACEDSINQAEEVSDGQMIRILTKEEAKEAPMQKEGAAASGASDGKINLNTADAGALMTLPGIGESKARSILSYREENGGFSSVEEIMNITGIKEGVYSKIKEYITVN